MWPEQQTPLVLTAMTLRGVGSYLRGARLEVRPLKILCGKNGSGKSTWLKALNLLRASLKANRLPFGFAVADWKSDDIQVTNAYYHRAYADAHAALADPTVTATYGPPGTIGLEFIAVHDLELPELSPGRINVDTLSGLPQEFLWLGKCPAGIRFRVRIAHPSYWDDQQPTPHLFHLIELQLDERHLISMRGERDPLQKFEEGCNRPRRAKPYELRCSAAFLFDSDTPADELPLATVTDLVQLRCQQLRDDVSPELMPLLVEQFDLRLRQLLKVVLDGYFYIGAVRQPHTHLSLETTDAADAAAILRERHVGAGGENAWLLERHFAASPMRPVILGAFSPQEIHVRRCLERLSVEARSQDERLSRLWELAAPEAKEKVASLEVDSAHELEAAASIACLLNGLLGRQDLFPRDCWLQHGECRDEDGEIQEYSYSGDVEIENYARHDAEHLSPRDAARLNRLLIEQALNGPSPVVLNGPVESSAYVLEEYVSYWMRRLTDTAISLLELLEPALQYEQWRLIGPSQGRNFICGPTGFLLTPDSHQWLLAGGHEWQLQRVMHPCFGDGLIVGTVQPPRQLSSGFHQVFPIIVQLALMRQGEFVGIENPEVHLHPSLQLELTETLVAHAVSGRRIFVETHSDLVIRRVIRSILEEGLSQADVRIYFTELGDPIQTRKGNLEVGFRHSILSPVEVDERGRISNWPDGFLNDDVRESQRLLDIMYGGIGSGESDE
jgi:hypothetical protein